MSHNTWIELQGMSPAVRGFTTTRWHGTSGKPYESLNLGEHVGDDPVRVAANRQRLNQWLPASPVWVKQVHGTRVVDAQVALQQPDIEADAMVTTQAGQVLGILTADCLPVVMADANGQVLALAHAGWRGLAAGVLGTTLAAMRAQGPQCDQWHAWIGPCISAQAFEVGDDVRDAFFQVDPGWVRYFTPDAAPHKWRCDLPGIAKRVLLELGAASVQWCGLCTATDPHDRFFSYRREGQTGRMATLAWLR